MITDKIIGICPTYEDYDCLKVTTSKVLEFVNEMIYIDGPFHNFPLKNKVSQDNTRNFLKEFDKVHLLDAGLCYMQDKINMAFHLASKLEYKYVILLGSDEWIEGDMKKFLANLEKLYENDLNPKIIDVDFQETNPHGKWNRELKQITRVFANPTWIRARFAHWFFSLYSRETPDSSTFVQGITINHNDLLRTTERNQLMEKYQDVNVHREREIIHKIIEKQVNTSI